MRRKRARHAARSLPAELRVSTWVCYKGRMQPVQLIPIYLKSLCAALIVLCLFAGAAVAQTQSAEQKTAEEDAVRSSLEAISSILDAQKAKRAAAKSLRRAIEKAETELVLQGMDKGVRRATT